MYNAAMPVAYEPTVPWTPRSGLGPYREDDYWALPDEPRCELLYGRLYVTPSPAFRHQELLGLLYERLLPFQQRAGGWLVFAPLDVRLAVHSVVQPDLLWISTARGSIQPNGRLAGIPELAVEILSPDSGRRDRGEKLKLYAKSGVDEYWIVDPATESFDFLTLRDGHYEVRLAEDGVYRSTEIRGLELGLATLWPDLARRERGEPSRA